MKKILLITSLSLCFCLTNAQNVQSDALATSGGLEAGTTTSGTGSNTFYGYRAGMNNNSHYNTFIGARTGQGTTTGAGNTFIGSGVAIINTTGSQNVCIGTSSGANILGNLNTCIGTSSGVNFAGNNNVSIGDNSGFYGTSTSNGNICIGSNSGYANKTNADTVGNKLFIDNSKTLTPLIWGDFANDLLKFNAKVGVGNISNFPTTNGTVDVSNYKLFVSGGILTEEVRVSLQSTWADYVFKKEYKLPTLQEVENHIQQKGHLINVPNANEIKANGIELGEMAKIQQEKIEELTLYIIEQNKINEKQAKQIEELKVLVNKLIEKK